MLAKTLYGPLFVLDISVLSFPDPQKSQNYNMLLVERRPAIKSSGLADDVFVAVENHP